MPRSSAFARKCKSHIAYRIDKVEPHSHSARRTLVPVADLAAAAEAPPGKPRKKKRQSASLCAPAAALPERACQGRLAAATTAERARAAHAGGVAGAS